MTTIEVLHDLQARDIRLTVDGDQLVYDAPEGAMTEAMLTLVRQHKTGLLALLLQPPPSNAEARAPEAETPPNASTASVRDTPQHGDIDFYTLVTSIRHGPFAALGGQTARVSGGILCRMAKKEEHTGAYIKDACGCGGDVWLVKLTTRRCVDCGFEDGPTPQDILGEQSNDDACAPSYPKTTTT